MTPERNHSAEPKKEFMRTLAFSEGTPMKGVVFGPEGWELD